MVPPMEMMETLPLLVGGDYAALALLVLAWFGITWWIERRDCAKPSVTVLMERYRRDWMTEMIERENRGFDAATVANLRQGTAFFASGSLIALGGVLALAGNADQLTMLADEIAFLRQAGEVWQLKLVVGALLLTHGFLCFVWSNRLFGYCAVVIAACPNDPADPACPHPRAAGRGDQHPRRAGAQPRPAVGLLCADRAGLAAGLVGAGRRGAGGDLGALVARVRLLQPRGTAGGLTPSGRGVRGGPWIGSRSSTCSASSAG